MERACWHSIRSPVVIQVPDFADRFWVYQIVDARTDSFASLGKMYGTTSGFYLLAAPNWRGEVPKGITKVFRATTDTGNVIPRVFQDDTPEDKRAVQSVLGGIMMYPLAEYDGNMKTMDWANIPGRLRAQRAMRRRYGCCRRRSSTCLPRASPTQGRCRRRGPLQPSTRRPGGGEGDPKLKDAMTKAAAEADVQLVKPLFEFRNYGLRLPHHWSTTTNNAAFGTDDCAAAVPVAACATVPAAAASPACKRVRRSRLAKVSSYCVDPGVCWISRAGLGGHCTPSIAAHPIGRCTAGSGPRDGPCPNSVVVGHARDTCGSKNARSWLIARLSA